MSCVTVNRSSLHAVTREKAHVFQAFCFSLFEINYRVFPSFSDHVEPQRMLKSSMTSSVGAVQPKERPLVIGWGRRLLSERAAWRATSSDALPCTTLDRVQYRVLSRLKEVCLCAIDGYSGSSFFLPAHHIPLFSLLPSLGVAFRQKYMVQIFKTLNVKKFK